MSTSCVPGPTYRFVVASVGGWLVGSWVCCNMGDVEVMEWPSDGGGEEEEGRKEGRKERETAIWCRRGLAAEIALAALYNT